jgi:hypothetical protein
MTLWNTQGILQLLKHGENMKENNSDIIKMEKPRNT